MGQDCWAGVRLICAWVLPFPIPSPTFHLEWDWHNVTRRIAARRVGDLVYDNPLARVAVYRFNVTELTDMGTSREPGAEGGAAVFHELNATAIGHSVFGLSVVIKTVTAEVQASTGGYSRS